MGSLRIYKGHLYEQRNFCAEEESDDGIAKIDLDGLGWLPESELEEVSFSDIQRWYRSSVFELDVMS